MANTINPITLYAAEDLDELFVKESVTSVLEGNNSLLRFVNAQTVMIPKITMDGLGDYSRSTGFPEGDVTLEWETHTLTKDRGRSFSIDNMDNEETANAAFGGLSKLFIKEKVAPEVDAYRLSTLLSKAASGNVTSGETISDNAIIKRLAEDDKLLLDNEVEPSECIRFISTGVNLQLETTTELSRRIDPSTYTGNNNVELRVKMINEVPHIVVPKARFYSAYTFGTSGFTKTSAAVEINFLTVHKNAAIAVKKHEKVRVFSPDVNQKADAWKYDYRIYHDIFTPDNKQVGITASTK